MAPPPQPPSLLLFSPSQLAYLHSSLSLQPPIRPDARTPTAFRSLRAETDILPAANASARVCFAEGGEAVVGIRAEVEQTTVFGGGGGAEAEGKGRGGEKRDREEEGEGEGDNAWVEVAIELREDEAEGVFLAEMLREAVLAGGKLKKRLVISRKWHWRLFVDIVLLSPPSTYPLPLLSLTTHLALLSCRLPALKSSLDDDPMFNDDWDAAIPLYPFVDVDSAAAPSTTPISSKTQQQNRTPQKRKFKPPITLLVISVGENIFFDPSSEELAVADAVLAFSIGQVYSDVKSTSPNNAKDLASAIDAGQGEGQGEELRLLAIRSINPPSREFASTTAVAATEGGEKGKGQEDDGVWTKRKGRMKRDLVSKSLKMILGGGGVGADVFRELETWA